MSRDSNGNATVNRQQAVTGQTVLAEQVNVPFADIQAMLNLVFWRDGLAPMTGPLNMNGFSITGLQDPSNGGDPVTLSYLNNTIAQSGVPTGAVQGFRMKTAPSGWVKENGGTIGSAASGATTRANADTLNLFTNQWNNFDNTERPIQTSAGVATTRGASAAADFAANKRFPLADSRSRFHRAADDGLGYDPSLIVGFTGEDTIKSFSITGTTDVGGNPSPTVRSTASSTSVTGTINTQFLTLNGTGAGAEFGGTMPSQQHQHQVTLNYSGGSETRPRFSTLLYCIKL